MMEKGRLWHDLRSSLNQVLSLGELMARGGFGNVSEEQSGCLDDIADLGRHLAQLLDRAQGTTMDFPPAEAQEFSFDQPLLGSRSPVLVVEDEEATRLALAVSLEKMGYEVQTVADGDAAWQLLESGHFPIVVLDWIMPGLHGVELCRRIRARGDNPYLYLIMLTGAAGKRNYLEAIQSGADDVLAKPYDSLLLAARLQVAERVLRLQDTNRKLAQFIPICSYCKRARDVRDKWQELEKFLLDNPDIALLSHSICPGCWEQVQLDCGLEPSPYG